jgi:hypothetical protein
MLQAHLGTPVPYYIPTFVPRTVSEPASVSARASRYATTVIHSRSYYKAVLLALLAGLANGHTDRQVAEALNDLKIPTPTGLQWDSEKIKTAYKRIRHHHRYPNRYYQAMTECVMWGELSHEQVMPLLHPRTRPGHM